MAEVTYSLLDDKVIVAYHREENRITATVREFIKPSKNDEKGKMIMWNPSTNYSIYMVKNSLFSMFLKYLQINIYNNN